MTALLNKNTLPTQTRTQNQNDSAQNPLTINYFDFLDETPIFSEAAILLEDGTVEHSYIKTTYDGNQYFGFGKCLPGTTIYNEIISRHKLMKKLEANTFEKYPSGKTVLSKRGKILEINV